MWAFSVSHHWRTGQWRQGLGLSLPTTPRTLEHSLAYRAFDSYQLDDYYAAFEKNDDVYTLKQKSVWDCLWSDKSKSQSNTLTFEHLSLNCAGPPYTGNLLNRPRSSDLCRSRTTSISDLSRGGCRWGNTTAVTRTLPTMREAQGPWSLWRSWVNRTHKMIPSLWKCKYVTYR